MVWRDLVSAHRHARQAVLLLGAVSVASVVAAYGTTGSHAATGSTCGQAVLSDWREDGEVDGDYDADCYLLAIDSLPEEARSYTSAADDIFRALHARRAEPDGADVSRWPAGAFSRSAGPASSEALVPASSAVRRPPAPVLLLAAAGLVLAGGAAFPLVTRRARQQS